jgi:hypothetical protein
MNNMKYQISLWHGPNAALEQKLTSVGCVKIKYDWFYEGTLDAFASDYKDKFMYIHNTIEKYPIIAVTQEHRNFQSH